MAYSHPARSSRMLRGALLVLVWLLVLGQAARAGDDLIASIGVLEDPTGHMTVEEVAGLDFAPARHSMAAGYTASAFWLRLRIMPTPDWGDVVLIVRPPMLDEVDLYLAASADDTWQGLSSGSRRALQPHEWQSSLRGFRLRPAAEGSDYYLRIRSSGSVAGYVSAMPAAEAQRLGLGIDLVQITYLALMLVLLIWSVRMFRLTREPIFFWFAVMQTAWIIHNVFIFGYVTILVTFSNPDVAFLLYRSMVFVATMLSLVFHRAVLVRFHPPRAALWLFNLQLGTALAALVLFWTVDRTSALALNAVVIFATPVVLLINAFTARADASPGLGTIRLIYALLAAALSMWVVTLFGWTDSMPNLLYGTMVHGISTGILMFVILNKHGRNLIDSVRAAEAELAISEQRRLLEEKNSQILAQFIDMLTHETRNALAVIGLSASAPNFGDRQRSRVQAAIAGLDGVIDRCNEAVRLEAASLQPRSEPCDIAGIIADLVHTSPEPSRIDVRAETPCTARCDSVLVRVIFGNLLDNALKYAPPNSPVVIRLAAAPGGCTVMFENAEGPAGAPDPARVFQKYYRHPGAQRQIGSGLGLYLVDRLVQRLGGRVAYDPAPHLVRFKVWLPC